MTNKIKVVYNCILHNKIEVPEHKNSLLEYGPPYPSFQLMWRSKNEGGGVLTLVQVSLGTTPDMAGCQGGPLAAKPLEVRGQGKTLSYLICIIMFTCAVGKNSQVTKQWLQRCTGGLATRGPLEAGVMLTLGHHPSLWVLDVILVL